MKIPDFITHFKEIRESYHAGVVAQHIRSADVPALVGAPIVFDTGCSSAGIDRGIPLRQTLPGSFFVRGAVAYLGNTRPARCRPFITCGPASGPNRRAKSRCQTWGGVSGL